MFFLMFGLFWTAISGTIAGVLFLTVSESGAGFSEIIFPMIFISIFILIGLAFLFVGIKQIFKNAITKKNGRETYGYIVDSYPNGTYVNDIPHYDAEVLLVEEDGTLRTYKESIGTKYNDYYPGIYVSVKHYKDDINILEIVYEGSVPYNIKNKIEAELGNTKKYRNSEFEELEKESICIDGVEYVKKEEDVILIDGVEYVKKK